MSTRAALIQYRGLEIGVILRRDAHKDASVRSGLPAHDLAPIFERFPGHLQQQAMLRIHERSLARGDAKKLRIEQVNVLDKSAPAAIGLAWLAWIRMVKLSNVPAIGWNLRHRVHSVAEELPKGLRVIGSARKSAADPNDGDGIGSCISVGVKRRRHKGSKLDRRHGREPGRYPLLSIVNACHNRRVLGWRNLPPRTDGWANATRKTEVKVRRCPDFRELKRTRVPRSPDFRPSTDPQDYRHFDLSKNGSSSRAVAHLTS